MKHLLIIVTFIFSSYCYSDSTPVEGFHKYRKNLLKANDYEEITGSLSKKHNSKNEKYAEKLVEKKKYKTIYEVYERSLERKKYVENCLTYKKLLEEKITDTEATLTFSVHDSCNEKKKQKNPKSKNIFTDYSMKVILLNENGWKFHKREIVFE